jgi:hypothetical protein
MRSSTAWERADQASTTTSLPSERTLSSALIEVLDK